MSTFSDLAAWATFRPMDPRPPVGTVLVERRQSPFRASWSSTVTLLERELRLVGAQRIVVELDMDEGDFRLDGLPRANTRARTPGVRISFQATAVHKRPSLRYAVDTFDRWEDNVRAIALGLEALRAVDRYGVTKRGEQYAGWKALPSGSGGPSAERGRELIARHGSVTAALKATHPDHGGDAAEFADVQAAREEGA